MSTVDKTTSQAKQRIFLYTGNMFGKAKKSLGQNFLKSPKILADIVAAGKITGNDTVLEIGPGRGALTRALLATGARVIAIEKDDALIAELESLFIEEITSQKLTLLHGDILECDPTDFDVLSRKYKVVANIPYYITGAIIEHLLSSSHQPTSATLLVQKEVAERIVARDNKESLLSISVKAYCEPSYAFTVKRNQFRPAPNVDSAVVHLAAISKKQFITISEERFFTVVKAGFAHRRKQLGNNLEGIIAKEKWSDCMITPQARAENLSVAEWICLAKGEA